MSISKISKSNNNRTLKITVDERDFLLEIKLDAREYFYPYLLVDPDHVHDYSYWKEYGMSKELYKKHLKINKMLQDKKYEDLFRDKFNKNLQDLLNKVEYEARIHYEDGESLEQKVSKNEDIIFSLIEKKGPSAFRHNAILDKIEHWSKAKDFPNIENLSTALKKYGKISRSYISFYDLEKRVGIINKYPYLRKRIRELKRDIALKEKMYRRHNILEDAIIAEWREKSQGEAIIRIPWFEKLMKLAKEKAEEEAEEEKAKTQIDFIPFIKQYSPRELCIMIYADLIDQSPHTIDKILRNKANILKTWVKFGREI